MPILGSGTDAIGHQIMTGSIKMIESFKLFNDNVQTADYHLKHYMQSLF